MHSEGSRGINPRRKPVFRLFSLIVAFLFAVSLVLVILPAPAARAQEFYPEGSLPEAGKKINQLIYPTFGYPAIQPRGGELTIEWDWRKSVVGNSRPALGEIDDPEDWEVWVTTSVAANVQNYNGAVAGDAENPPADWYEYNGPAYGAYESPVHTVVNDRALEVVDVSREASQRWPEIFGQAGFEVDHITVEIPLNLPLDLYDLNVRCVSGEVSGEFLITDGQPHALQVIEDYKDDLKILHITDTHVYGQEIKNGWNLDYNSYELREPRPGTPDRSAFPLLQWEGFPLDKDMDGKSNEGAIYLQETLQAINLVDPDFAVFTGDAVFAQKNYNTYPKFTPFWGAVTGDVGTEYRFELPWWYDELLALNVPVFCVPGNHDSICLDGRVVERDDGQEIWQDLFGPLYYSWDYGEMHFLAVNGMDWHKLDADGPDVFEPTDTNPLLWFLATMLYPELAEDWVDRGGFLLDFGNLFVPIKVISPHKWHGQILGSGDPYEWEPWPWGPDPGGDGFTGQLAWIEDELHQANLEGKDLKGVFLHFDPLNPLDGPPGNWNHAKQFGLLEVPAGHGEGSQAFVYLMRKYEVDFVASGHTHSDNITRIDWAPYGGSPGELVSINTIAVEPPVDGKSLLLDPVAEKYGGYRLICIEDGELGDWGFAGSEGDPDYSYSIPGWEGLTVGAGAVNDYLAYRNNRPVLQWMEQDDSTNPDYHRPPITDGEGAFSQALPLNETGPFSDVTCKVKNTLNQTGAVLDLTDCRIEFPMVYLDGGQYYAAHNGEILEQYDADSGERMVVVLADVNGGTTLPVRVCVGGADCKGPVIGTAEINGGEECTDDLEVELRLVAHDEGAGLMDFRVSNRRDFAGAEWMPCEDEQEIILPWRLRGSRPGRKRVFVEFRDAAMPGNTTSVKLVIRYNP